MQRGTKVGLVRFIAGLIAAAFAAAMVVGFFAPPITVVRDQAQLQVIADRSLPRSFDRFGSTFTVERIAITLDNMLHIEGSGSGEIKARRKKLGDFTASFSASGQIAYKDDRGGKAFFVEDAKVTPRDFAFNGQSLGTQVSKWAERFKSQALRDVVGAGSEKLDEQLPTIVAWSMERWLESFPVYRLNDDAKGYVLSMSLKNVQVENGKLHITFSLRQITWSLLFLCFGFVVACGVLVTLFANPELLLPFVLLSVPGN